MSENKRFKKKNQAYFFRISDFADLKRTTRFIRPKKSAAALLTRLFRLRLTSRLGFA